MKQVLRLSLTLMLFILAACQPSQKKQNKATATTTALLKGDQVINEAIQKHGGDLYKTASYAFNFRNKTYSFYHKDSYSKYTVAYEQDGKKALNVLENDTFTITVNNQLIVKDNANNKYAHSLNSVIYFTLLPFKLNDASVVKEYKESTLIYQKPYDVVQVTFKKEGGGKDHDDIFYYWIHQENKTVDFLAYKYHTNGGGIRFRKAFNTRDIDGILFQDYINYKAPLTSSLSDLPKLLEQNKLIEVSKIEIDNISNIAK